MNKPSFKCYHFFDKQFLEFSTALMHVVSNAHCLTHRFGVDKVENGYEIWFENASEDLLNGLDKKMEKYNIIISKCFERGIR